MPMHPVPDYVLPVSQVVTPYEWYQVSGQCELTDDAYTQCVDWKQSNYRRGKVVQSHPSPYEQRRYTNIHEKPVYKVDSETGQAYVDREMREGHYQVPSYGMLEAYQPMDLYRGSSILPVEITDSYGRKRMGSKVVKDNKGDTKDVTIANQSSGLSNTLKLKDSQKVMHVQEIDEDGDYIDDLQLVTVCDEDTYTCDVVALNLDDPYLDQGYVEHVDDEIDYAAKAMPHESLGEPMIVDPLSVGANADDVCWLEDIIVGSDYKGDAIVETEVFCADAGDLYVEPLVDYMEPAEYVEEDDYSDDYVEPDMGDYAGDVYEQYVEELPEYPQAPPKRPPRPTRQAGFPTKPKQRLEMPKY